MPRQINHRKYLIHGKALGHSSQCRRSWNSLVRRAIVHCKFNATTGATPPGAVERAERAAGPTLQRLSKATRKPTQTGIRKRSRSGALSERSAFSFRAAGCRGSRGLTVRFNHETCQPACDLDGGLIAGDLPGHVGALHQQAQLLGQPTRVGGACVHRQSMHEVFDRLACFAMPRRGPVRAGSGNSMATLTKMQPWKSSDSMMCSTTSNTACSWPIAVAAALANHRAKGVLQPAVLHFQGRQHQVFFALEVLVERRLADPHVRQNLVDADVAKSVAIEATNGRIRPAAGECGVVMARFFRSLDEVDHKSTCQCTTSQLCGDCQARRYLPHASE